MNKAQWAVILSAACLFALLFWGFDTKPATHKEVEKRRQLGAVSTDVNSLITDARKELPASALNSVAALEHELDLVLVDSARIGILKQLAGLWYNLDKVAISGHYAEKIAELERSEEAWSIAGTTYSICVEKETEEKVKSYCTQKAIQALENAASLNPGNPQHKINLALVYAENPPADAPMKGITMLMELRNQYPDNPAILTQLGRLAIKTGQYQKAVERLEQALAQNPDNPKAICLLAQAYAGIGDDANAATYRAKCDKSLNL